MPSAADIAASLLWVLPLSVHANLDSLLGSAGCTTLETNQTDGLASCAWTGVCALSGCTANCVENPAVFDTATQPIVAAHSDILAHSLRCLTTAEWFEGATNSGRRKLLHSSEHGAVTSSAFQSGEGQATRRLQDATEALGDLNKGCPSRDQIDAHAATIRDVVAAARAGSDTREANLTLAAAVVMSSNGVLDASGSASPIDPVQALKTFFDEQCVDSRVDGRDELLYGLYYDATRGDDINPQRRPILACRPADQSDTAFARAMLTSIASCLSSNELHPCTGNVLTSACLTSKYTAFGMEAPEAAITELLNATAALAAACTELESEEDCKALNASSYVANVTRVSAALEVLGHKSAGGGSAVGIPELFNITSGSMPAAVTGIGVLGFMFAVLYTMIVILY